MKGRVAKVTTESGVSKEGKNWERVGVLITTDSQYDPNVYFGTTAKCGEFAKTLKTGQEVEIEYNLKSREYNGRWYTEANAWKINVVGDAPTDTADNQVDGLPW